VAAVNTLCFLQCSNTVGWVTGRTSSPLINLYHLSSDGISALTKQTEGDWLTRFTWKTAVETKVEATDFYQTLTAHKPLKGPKMPFFVPGHLHL